MPLGDRFDGTGWIVAEGFWPVLRRDEGSAGKQQSVRIGVEAFH